MQNTIHVEGLRIYAYHGVEPQEARVGNTFEVDLELTLDATEAIAADNLDGTVNYAAVVEIIKAEMAVPSRLLEHVAGRIVRAVVAAFPAVSGGRLSVWKLAPPITAQLSRVGFTINW